MKNFQYPILLALLFATSTFFTACNRGQNKEEKTEETEKLSEVDSLKRALDSLENPEKYEKVAEAEEKEETEEEQPEKASQKESSTAKSNKSSQKAPESSTPPKQEEPKVITISVPKGTNIPVKTAQDLVVNQLKPNDVYAGTISVDVLNNNAIVIPQGTKVQGKVISLQNEQKMAGRSKLVLEVTHINMNGTMLPAKTAPLELQGKSQTGKTAKRTAVGAGVGALIGGGEGALIGAGAGALLSAVGPKGTLAVPAGSVLQFQLANTLSYQITEE